MDYSKYENRKKYPSLREEKAYKMTLEGQVYKLTATGEEIKKMLNDIPNKVKKWKKDMISAYNQEQNNNLLKFKKDAMKELGLDEYPRSLQDRIFSKSLSDCSSFGYYEMFQYLTSMAELLEGFEIKEKES